MMLALYHASPAPIGIIAPDGLFGSLLCFANKPYFMTRAAAAVVYELEIDEDDLLDSASRFRFIDDPAVDAAVAEIAELVGCDESTALDLLSERASLSETDFPFDAELDFSIQRIAGECAVKLGYRGVVLSDEQGSLYLIDMLGREAELQTQK